MRLVKVHIAIESYSGDVDDNDDNSNDDDSDDDNSADGDNNLVFVSGTGSVEKNRIR